MSNFLLIALAIAAITVTIGETLIFKPIRERSWFLKKLLQCPYCLSHWLSFFAVLLLLPYDNLINLVIQTMAMVAVSSIVALPIFLYILILEKTS